ncbi:MAG: serine-type D-Ala-D-Ala carboxypeptidase [Nitrospirales bacterium]|nr:MAG: serine-type D-Ala-D-Ala carboxypeptidase [Nitrospirales bacterium]
MPLVGLTTFLLLAPIQGIWAWVLPLPATVQEQLDDAIGHGLDGVIVYVDRAGQPPAFFASGLSDRAAQQPADPHALFKIASISKLYIAVATAKLVHGQRLSLDNSLADYLPELAGRIENAEQITLRMMIRHRSGIPNYVDDEAFDWADPALEVDENLALVLDEPADFEPDTAYRYSNTNYLLIGRILDNELGYDHQQYIKQQITGPLGLSETHGLLRDVALEDVVSGYFGGLDDDFKPLEFVVPGGSMVATAEDVGVFLRALVDGSLLNDDEQAIYSSIYEYGHTGWVLGYQSIARYHEDIDAVVVQFVNTTGNESELVANVVYGRIVRILARQ